jgi:hypothetical protein
MPGENPMNFHKRAKNFNPVTSIGLVFLIVANVSSYLLKRGGNFSESFVDGMSGFLFGVAIATLLLGIALSVRQIKQKTSGDTC